MNSARHTLKRTLTLLLFVTIGMPNFAKLCGQTQPSIAYIFPWRHAFIYDDDYGIRIGSRFIRIHHTFTLVSIDGRPVRRWYQHPLEDLPKCAVIGPGQHLFEVSVLPEFEASKYTPRLVSFTASVEAGKTYFVIDKDANGTPTLIEDPNF